MSEKTGFPPTAPEVSDIADPPPPYSAEPPGYKQEENFQQAAKYPKLPHLQPEAQPIVQQVQPVIVQQVIQAPPLLTVLGPSSVRVTCPHCRADMSTTTIKDASMAAYISAVVLFLIGCVCGCCLIPFCMDSCKNVEHRCAHCKKFVGRYSKYC